MHKIKASMNRFYLDTKKIKLENITDLLNQLTSSTLIVSLIQENRKLEDKLGIADYVIYDNQDYISRVLTLEDAVIEVDDNIDILASSYKIKVNDFDFNILSNDLNVLEYDNVIVLFDDKLNVENKPQYSVLSDIKEAKLDKNYDNLNEDKKNNKDQGLLKRIRRIFIND